MNSFFKNIGLYDRSSLTIEINTNEFVERLKKITYKTNLNFISLISDSTIPTRFEYRGQVSANKFIIRRRKHFFDVTIINSVLNGILSEENKNTSITLEIMPSKYHVIPFILMTVLFLLITFTFIREKKTEEILWPLIIPLIINISYYFTLKRSIKRNKYDFERELNYIIQKENHFKNYK